MATEGHTTGVSFRSEDSAGGDAARFCLDGQKLIGVSGTYGAGDAEYRTETSHITKIVSREPTGSGPGSFDVWAKNGHHLEFLAQGMDRISANQEGFSLNQDSAPLTYPLTKDTDPSGNVIEYSYTLDKTELPGGSAHSSELLRLPFPDSTMNGTERRRYVKFTYGKRSDLDRVLFWTAGVRQDQTKVLTGLEMNGPNPSATGKLWSYAFDYGTGKSGRSRLEKISRCGALGGCALQRTFTYSNNDPSFEPKVIESDFTLSKFYKTVIPPPLQAADYNGDGVDDLIYKYHDSWTTGPSSWTTT